MPKVGQLKLPNDPLRVQVGRKDEWNEERSAGEADFFTVGYSSRSLANFIGALKSVSVSTVIDVRQYAVSMYKPEFSKRNLEASLEAEGMMYLHLPELGVPREIRSLAIETADRGSIWTWYDANIVMAFERNLHSFFNIADHPVALLCTELDPTSCHRHRLALALERCGLRGYDL